MSRDSTTTYIHLHASHHADLFEEFCHPPSSTNSALSNNINGNSTANVNNQSHTANQGNNVDPSMIHIPGHFLPFEEIQLPPHLMPLNPEDEDDVVPDMHAAFGITRALNGMQIGGMPVGQSGEGSGRGAQQEPVWRDLGMDRLLDNLGGHGGTKTGASAQSYKREGKKSGLLLMR